MEHYRLGKEIGKGSYGVVYLVTDIRDGNTYVMKKLQTANIPARERDAQLREVRLLAHLKHPNIVHYHESFEDQHQNLCIVMEYCERGDLYQELKRARGRLLPEKVILDWFVQMVLALHYLHSKKVLHRDLKTQNIFLTTDGQIKLGDFGIAKILDGTAAFAMTVIGTPYYMSPELYNNKPYSFKSDSWSMGCILYEMATQRHAFDAKNLTALGQKVCRGQYQPLPSSFGSVLRNLVKGLLSSSPMQRPSMAQILSKPALAQRIHHMLESCYGINSQNVRQISSNTDTPLGKLCSQLDALAIQPPIPEDVDPINKVRRLKEEELRVEEQRRNQVQAQLARLNPRARQVAAPPPRQGANKHKRQSQRAGHKQRRQQQQQQQHPISQEQQDVRDLDRFEPPARAPRDRVVVPEVHSEAALKARNELLDIQKRLEALQQLQSKLSHIDGQVEELVPGDEGAAPDPSILPQPRYMHGNNITDTAEVSAKERVLLRKEAERAKQQREYEEQLERARHQNKHHNLVAEERKKHEYGMDKQQHSRPVNPDDRPIRPLSDEERKVAIEAELNQQLMESTARIEQLKLEHGGYDEEDEEDNDTDGLTSDEDLSLSEDEDDPSEMSGNLDTRAQALQKRCMDALGDKFPIVYQHLVQAREMYDDAMSDEAEEALEKELVRLVGEDLMGYVKLVEQLIFIEECLK
eukprot:TRINITY_DN2294_c0_g1_i3.p1 TRINITY_DN2294_c0_g1~~TRINITY_DN2294_c0_g1_i3.p1  ORF type:complete len:694 (-),score=222.63 TRINITY_DN2294_c0_g1_i3:401-2482(-)